MVGFIITGSGRGTADAITLVGEPFVAAPRRKDYHRDTGNTEEHRGFGRGAAEGITLVEKPFVAAPWLDGRGNDVRIVDSGERSWISTVPYLKNA